MILGLDGQDPELTDQFLQEGLLSNFARLRDQGCYTRLETTIPAESPVAWSSFQTGCNPGWHGVFDFLVPNRKSYLPELSTARIETPFRSVSIGPYRIPLGRPRIISGRKSQPFWKILGEHGVFSTIIRVSVTFPPEKFHGLLLSGMSVPDLKGSQGIFSYYSAASDEKCEWTGGMQIPILLAPGSIQSFISGPQDPYRKDRHEMRISFRIQTEKNGDYELTIEKKYPLKLHEYTPWIPLSFRTGLGTRIHGMCRFYLQELLPNLKLYLSPLHVDPQKPALPISHPFTYAVYLSKTQGKFATLGVAEDSLALNEGVIDEESFLKQSYSIHEERKRMFLDALEKTKRGLLVCVFDITDRIHHMFWRYLEEDHPANRGKDIEKYRGEIRKLYQEMDALVGELIRRERDGTLVMVLSDHGCKSFQRSVNLNTWLYENGYLAVNPHSPYRTPKLLALIDVNYIIKVDIEHKGSKKWLTQRVKV